MHVICPSVSDLEEDCKKNICCPVSGCGKILPQKQSLKFHVVKVHGIIKVFEIILKCSLLYNVLSLCVICIVAGI